MDTTISQILHGCKLARDIEANLPNLVNQHYQALKDSCEEVARAFNNAIHELDVIMPRGDQDQLQAMDRFGSREIEEANFSNNPFYIQNDAVVGVEGSTSRLGQRPGSGSSGRRQGRKRKESAGVRKVRVPAVRMGNMKIPPDDGYTWRKYGQKDILNSRFPKSYYRCTHRSFYGCEAKKQVQRLDEDPYTCEVTYCGDHTCQTSTTPLILHPLIASNDGQFDQATNSSLPLQPSFSTDLSTTTIQLGNINNNVSNWFDINVHSRAGVGESSVAVLADAMFNSGSSGSSMDAILSFKHESWKDKEE